MITQKNSKPQYVFCSGFLLIGTIIILIGEFVIFKPKQDFFNNAIKTREIAHQYGNETFNCYNYNNCTHESININDYTECRTIINQNLTVVPTQCFIRRTCRQVGADDHCDYWNLPQLCYTHQGICANYKYHLGFIVSFMNDTFIPTRDIVVPCNFNDYQCMSNINSILEESYLSDIYYDPNDPTDYYLDNNLMKYTAPFWIGGAFCLIGLFILAVELWNRMAKI